MKTKSQPVEKWERRFEDEYTVSIWKYNSKISRVNPYEVSIQYKKEPKEVVTEKKTKTTRTRKTK
jgi:hypothetical protein